MRRITASMGGQQRASAKSRTEGSPQGALSNIRTTMTTLTALARPATLLHAGTPLEDLVDAFLALCTGANGRLLLERGRSLMEAYATLMSRLSPWGRRDDS